LRGAPARKECEFINAGVILSCPAQDFLAARIELDAARLLDVFRHVNYHRPWPAGLRDFVRTSCDIPNLRSAGACSGESLPRTCSGVGTGSPPRTGASLKISRACADML